MIRQFFLVMISTLAYSLTAAKTNTEVQSQPLFDPTDEIIQCSGKSYPSMTNNPILLWLESASTEQIVVVYKPIGELAGIDIYHNHDFIGEIAILSSTNQTVYQAHHELKAGKQHLNLKAASLKAGQYLVLLHDFENRDLRIMKLAAK